MPDIETIHEQHTLYLRLRGHQTPSEATAELPKEKFCRYYLPAPCMIMDGGPRGPPRSNNNSNCLTKYRLYYTFLYAKTLWENL